MVSTNFYRFMIGKSVLYAEIISPQIEVHWNEFSMRKDIRIFNATSLMNITCVAFV